MASPDQKRLHLIGVGVGHSIAPSMHNHICKALNKPWTFYATEAPTLEAAISLLKAPDSAGAVITMPYKQSVIQHLDALDDVAAKIGACNNVYLTTDGKLRGTNTDWRGVYGCLLAASEAGIGKPAMIVGAGGASRAAVSALALQLRCPEIYVVNRDVQEVKDLIRDTEALRASGESGSAQIIHIQSVDEAETLATPHYVVSTVPDLVPQTEEEKTAIRVFDHFLSRSDVASSGVFLDMCFKPRVTRKIKLARLRGWKTVEGTEIIGHQIQEQYRLWISPDSDPECTVIDAQLVGQAWEVLRQQAEAAAGINFDVDVDELDVS